MLQEQYEAHLRHIGLLGGESSQLLQERKTAASSTMLIELDLLKIDLAAVHQKVETMNLVQAQLEKKVETMNEVQAQLEKKVETMNRIILFSVFVVVLRLLVKWELIGVD
jgi:hypothetical protein